MKFRIVVPLFLSLCFLFGISAVSQDVKKAEENKTEENKKVEKIAKVEKVPEEDEENFFESEEKFCEIAKNNGIREAFEVFGSRNSQFVQTTSISFRQWLEGVEEGKKEEFFPSQMVVSSSRDLGLSVGSWKEGEGKFMLWGNYLNVWEKTGKEWKIVIHSKTVLPIRISFKKEKSTEKIELSSERKPARNAAKIESEMLSVLKDYGWAKIYNEFGDENLIRMRSDALMEKGKKTIFIKSVTERGYIEGKVKKSISSKSKDLVLFIGAAKTGGPQISAQGNFIHIWKKDSEGNYKLFLDFFASERMQDRVRKKLL